MRRAAGLALVALVLVPAQAGAGTARPPLGLMAMPARIALAGSGVSTVRVTNPGLGPIVVDVARAGFALDLHGRPRIGPRDAARAAASWLTVRPRRFALPAGGGRTLVVSSRLPTGAEPGDHDALVLLTTRPRRGAGVAVRMRIGLVVVVRAPGLVVHRLAVYGLQARRSRVRRVLDLRVANRGNVTETLDGGRLRVVVARGGRQARLRVVTRDLRPRTSGVVQLLYGRRLRGWVTARVELGSPDGARVVRRTFRVRL